MSRLQHRKDGISAPLRFLPPLVAVLWIGMVLFSSSCQYREPRFNSLDSVSQVTIDSVTYLYKYHYTLGTNLIIQADTLLLSQFPIADTYDTLFCGDTVVVAEFMINPMDTLDSVWVKIAHNQDIQGWIREADVNRDLRPINLISKLIIGFSRVHTAVFFVLVALFVCLYGIKRWKREKFQLVFYHDIDSAYPILLCFLTAFCATLYETMQMWYPQTWEHFYFNPTLNPFKVPFILALFLLGLWAIVVVFLAAVEETLKMLNRSAAFFYLAGLVAACVICYTFFIFAAHWFMGYLLLVFFFYRLMRKIRGTHTYHYRCGKCGMLLKEKGKCPTCGAINE